MVGNNAALPDELVEPLPGHGALAVGINIRAMAVPGRRAVYVTWKRMGPPFVAGPSTRCRSRAWKR